MLQRILTALIGIPAAAALVVYGGLPLLIVTLCLAVLSLDELFNALDQSNINYSKKLGFLGGASLVCLSYFGNTFFVEFVLLFVAVNLVFFVLLFPRYDFEGVGVVVLSSIYIGYFLSFIVLLRALPGGEVYLLFALVMAWSTDIGAYFAGVFLGKHKLSPELSPNKTKEGAIGGIFLPVLAALIASSFFPVKVNGVELAFIGALSGILGQFGDLVASGIKRQTRIKDFGSIIPGHGGIMDRFDSFLFIAPFVYFYLILFILG